LGGLGFRSDSVIRSEQYYREVYLGVPFKLLDDRRTAAGRRPGISCRDHSGQRHASPLKNGAEADQRQRIKL
jgi:hypothetical protein